MKIGVAVGSARRFVIGDPEIQLLDVMAGALLDDLAEAEHHAQKGEVVLTEAAANSFGPAAQIQIWREDTALNRRFGVLDHLSVEATPSPWPELVPPLANG